MPLYDHFRPPIDKLLPWESLHSSWATYLASSLNENWLPQEFRALEDTHGFGSLEIDVATYEMPNVRPLPQGNGPPVATLTQTYAPSQPARSAPAIFPDSFEVHVLEGLSLVAAIELISPGNKDRPDTRRAFAIKCASYLQKGVSVVIIDVVTHRRANLHNELSRLMEWTGCDMPVETSLYAAAYRPVRRNDKPEIDLWLDPCTVGQPLPTMPLRLKSDLFVPVEFEAAYHETCRKRRLI